MRGFTTRFGCFRTDRLGASSGGGPDGDHGVLSSASSLLEWPALNDARLRLAGPKRRGGREGLMDLSSDVM